MNHIKKCLFTLGGLCLLLIGSMACSSSSSDPAPLELEKKVVEIYPEEIFGLKIISGESPYEVIVGDESLLDAQVHDDKVVLMGKGITGDLNLVVRDNAEQVVGLYVIISEKEVFMQVTGLENQARIDDEKVKKEIEEDLAKKPFPVEKGGGYKLIYRDRDKGNLIVYDKETPSELWKGTFELENDYEIKMVYEKKGEVIELNYVIAPDIINPSHSVSRSMLRIPRWIFKEDWTDYYRGELNLLQLEFAAKLQYIKSTILQ